MILVIGAHPDDAEVGMGGTIIRYSKKGVPVKIIILTIPSDNKNTRIKECEKSAKVLGAQFEFLDVPPNELDFDRKHVSLLGKVISKNNPKIVFTHWIGDSHQDHINTAKCTIAACRKNESSLYMYEEMIPGGITPFAFNAQMFVDISPFIEKKLQAIMEHKTQADVYGKSWLDSIKSRANYRGFQTGVRQAEAFEVIRRLVRNKGYD